MSQGKDVRRPRPLAAVPNRRPSPAPRDPAEVSQRISSPEVSQRLLAPEVSQRIPAHRAPVGPAVSQRIAAPRANAAEVSQRLPQVRATPAVSQALAREVDLKALRGYQQKDLMAVAELGYHYLFSGGYALAQAIFEGLNAVDPRDAYYATALGLVHDRLGDVEEAEVWYRRAAALDPTDPRPEVNRAELRILRRDFAKARELLIRGANKAKAARDQALETKARALLSHISNAV